MPQAIPIIISAFQAAASYAAAATFAITGSAGLASFVANTILGVAGVTTAGLPLASAAASFIQASLLQQLMKAISPKPKNLNGGSQVRFGPNPQAPRPFIFGRTGTAGTPAVATTHGSGKNNNKWLTYIVALSCFGPVQSIEALALNQVNAPITGGMVTSGQYANRVWCTYRNGEWAQAWTPTFGPSTIPEWTPNHRGAGIAHACLTYEYDTNVFTGGAPAPVWTVQGSTGIYNASTLSLGYSANPADVYYTLLRGIQSPNGNRIGVGLDAAYIDQARIAAWRAVCAANNWTCGGVWQITAENLGDVLRAILQSGGAEFAISDGKASVDFFTSAASAYTIRENDLSGDPIERPTTDRKARVSRIVPRFRSEAEGWELVPAAAVQDSTLDTEDRGRRRTDTMDFPYVSSAQQARQLAAYNLRVRRSPIVELPVKPHGIGIPCGARVTLDLPEYGISSNTGVVIKNEATATEGGILAVRLDPADLHSWALGQDGSTVSPGSMPRDPASTVQNVDPADWTASAASITSSGTTLPIIRVTGTFPNPTLARLDVQIKPSTSTEWVDTTSLVAGTPALEIRSLTPNTVYNLRARYITTGGVASPAWVNLPNVTTGAYVAGEAAAGIGGAPILNSQVTGFANQAIDTEFQYVLRTWTNNFANGGAWTFGTNTTNGTRWLRRSSSNAPAGTQVNIGHDAAMTFSVVAGQRIEASVTFNWLNFSVGRLFVTWYDANRGYITETFVGQTTTNGGSVGGFVTVPANARYAGLTTASDTVTASIASWIEIGRPFLRIASAEQTALSPYVPGPVERNADQTGSNTAAAFIGQGNRATTNVYRQSTAPTSPVQWDEWQDTSTTPVIIKLWIYGSWVPVGEEGATIGAVVGGNFRFPDGSIAPVGRVDNALSPLGVNQVINSDFNQGTTGFFPVAATNMSGTGFQLNAGRNLPGWFGIRNVLWTEAAVPSGSLSPGGGGYLYGWAQVGFFGGLANLNRYATRVKAGDRVYVGQRLAAHRCLNAAFEVRWFDKDGNWFDVNYKEVAVPNGGWGNGDPINATLVEEFYTAPPNAAFVVTAPYISNLYVGVQSAYLFQGDPIVAVLPVGQTTAPVYTPGPVDRAADRTGENTAGSITGQGSGATANNLSGLNPGEGAKLGGIESGADVTAGKTAAAIAGQGNNATRNTNAGLLGSRPTGVDGDTYHATDTKEIYFKTGGTWIKVADVANTFGVALSTTSLIATGTGTTLTTGNVTATPSGGTGPYTYAWAVITKDVQSLNPFMTSQSATSACRCTLGAGQAVEGTIQLIVTDTATGAIVIKTLTYNITNTA